MRDVLQVEPCYSNRLSRYVHRPPSASTIWTRLTRHAGSNALTNARHTAAATPVANTVDDRWSRPRMFLSRGKQAAAILRPTIAETMLRREDSASTRANTIRSE